MEISQSNSVRSRFHKLVVNDLMGPRDGEHEVIERISPRDYYITGILYPKNESLDSNVDDDILIGDGVDDSEEGVEQEEIKKRYLAFPSSMGISFSVLKDLQELDVIVDWGVYDRIPGGQDEKGREIPAFRRFPVTVRKRVKLNDNRIKIDLENAGENNQSLLIVIRKSPDAQNKTVSIFFTNDRVFAPRTPISYYIFQPKITIQTTDSSYSIVSPSARLQMGGDPYYRKERKKFEMLYRKNREFGTGHNCSCEWHPEDVNPKDFTQLRKISTAIFPEYEVEKTVNATESGLLLDMKELARGDKSEIISSLQLLIDRYELWIYHQLNRVKDPNEKLEEFLNDGLLEDLSNDWLTCKRRMADGIEMLKNDEIAWAAFQFANEAIYEQRLHAAYANHFKEKKKRESIEQFDIPSNRTWRMFQLGFFLLNITTLRERTHPERSGEGATPFCDLIWFPTGGGKTEAYLALTAFTLGVRRLEKDFAGVSVLMRYTLRLLTLQQFERATALISACEIIRRKDPNVWGEIPFRVGLWVGKNTTPNSYEDSKQAISKLKKQQTVNTSSPQQLTHCPWCGEMLKADFFESDDIRERTLQYCSDPNGICDFSKKNSNGEGLPILTVDSEIYRFLPALLISTVDKFAQMAWKGQVAKLFGKVSRYCPRHGYLCPDDADHEGKSSHSKTQDGSYPKVAIESLNTTLRPPDLIIQDELHLISGPLGSITGLYETAIDELCTYSLNGKLVRPKIIASSATVKFAKSQVDALFQRTVQVFPPSGLDASDNFFSKTADKSIKGNEGRLYVGICAPGIRMKVLLIRVASALLSSAAKLKEELGSEIDPYWTVVGYFNSLRELGGMRRLLEDDISSRIANGNFRKLANRYIKNSIEELTSRISQSKVRNLLTKLEEGLVDSDSKTKNPISVLLATNMISVGVDIQRLGLMMISGQPKYTSEYIQASSRVGRNKPGIVFSLYNWARPRDLSHYERFQSYHASFYKFVEPNSVTPFSDGARRKGFTGLIFSLIRSSILSLNANSSIGSLKNFNKEIEELLERVHERAKHVLGEEYTSYEENLMNQWKAKKDKWLKRLADNSGTHVYRETQRAGDIGFLASPENSGRNTDFTALNSLRDVESNSPLYIRDDKVLKSLSAKFKIEMGN